jgi:hypothetical protein
MEDFDHLPPKLGRMFIDGHSSKKTYLNIKKGIALKKMWLAS